MLKPPRRLWPCLFPVLGACVLLVNCGSPKPVPRTLVAYVGAGRDTASINLFFPATIRVRAGDTVTWRMNADGDPHTVTFSNPPDEAPDIVPAQGQGPLKLMFNPKLLTPTRRPGQPVETYEGIGTINSGIFFGAV